MDALITGFGGSDAHAESTAVAVAGAGRAAPRLIGTAGSKRAELLRTLDKLGPRSAQLAVYDAGPCGYELARDVIEHGDPARWWHRPRSPAAAASGSRPTDAMR